MDKIEEIERLEKFRDDHYEKHHDEYYELSNLIKCFKIELSKNKGNLTDCECPKCGLKFQQASTVLKDSENKDSEMLDWIDKHLIKKDMDIVANYYAGSMSLHNMADRQIIEANNIRDLITKAMTN